MRIKFTVGDRVTFQDPTENRILEGIIWSANRSGIGGSAENFYWVEIINIPNAQHYERVLLVESDLTLVD